MSNEFYNPTGNPGTGAEGLSSTMRQEFANISTGFDLLPVIAGNANKAVVINSGGTAMTVSDGTLILAGNLTTTGAFNTTLAQSASITLTLPGTSGTLALLASPAFSGVPTAPTATPGTSTTQLATTAFTTGAVATETARATSAEGLLAPLASPGLTGTPTAPTATPGTNTTQLATTAFDTAAVLVETNRALAAETLLAPKASPALTGTPTAPTAAPGTNTTQVGTTAFTTAAVLVETNRATAAEVLLAPIASPTLTGTPAAPTAAPGTNTTQLATTAYVTAAVTVETGRATTAEGLLAPKASPTLTGTPLAPTAAPGTNTTQIATTAYSTAAVAVETSARTTADNLLAPRANPSFTGSLSASGPVVVTGINNSAGSNGFTVQNLAGNQTLVTNNAGQVTMPVTPSFTTGSAANLFMDGSGIISFSTSSRRYKHSIEDYPNPLTAARKLQPVRFKSRSERDGDRRFAGFIAEDVHDAGLHEFVSYVNDVPNGIEYGPLSALAIGGVNELADVSKGMARVLDDLLRRIAVLEAKQ